ncbi:hypothetical protein Tco_1201721 [Tanacetum coccineum]
MLLKFKNFNIYEWQAKLNAKDVSIANLKKQIENLKGKNVVEKVAPMNNAKVIAPGMFTLDLEPLSPKELGEHAKALKPLDNDLDFACLVVPVFTQGDNPITYVNKAMAFMIAVASLSYAGTGYMGNATSSRGNNAEGQARVVKCYNYQGEGYIARQCTQPKRPRNAAWFKEKAMLTEAQESGQILDEEQLEFLADPGILDSSSAMAIFPTMVQNLSNYGFEVISEVPHSEPYHHDMYNQSVHAMQDFEQTPVVDFTDNEITSNSSKNVLDNTATITNATTIAPGMFKLDLDPLAPRSVPSCFLIYDLELLSFSFDFVFSSKIFKYLSFRLDRLFHLAILCLDQHAHTLHHLESLLTISLDRLDIFEGRSCILELCVEVFCL